VRSEADPGKAPDADKADKAGGKKKRSEGGQKQ
jgi:hypothetical protein